MKNLKRCTLIFLAFLSLTVTSCDNNDNEPKGEFQHGVFVVNEGNFGKGNGTVSFINTNDAAVTQNLFGTVNNGLALGDVVQSMTIHDDHGYIVVNNSNKMEVVNANTFEAEYSLNGLALPRYFTTLDGKGYVTEWVSFTDPGRVSIIDLEAHTVKESITTDYGAENILALQGKLYVSNNFSNTVSVVDPVTKTVIKTIEVASSPGELLVDNTNMLWVVCGGSYMGNDGALVQLDPAKSNDPAANSVLKTIPLNVNIPAKAAVNKDRNKIFYFKGTSVYVLTTSATTAPASALVTETQATDFYGIGIDPDTDVLYLADTKAFAANGTVFRYTLTGTVVDNVAAGIGPSGFVFK